MAYTGIISDVRTSGSGVLAANQKPDIDTVLKLLEPYQTPFLQHLFFSNKKSTPVINKSGKFSWFEDEYLPHQTTVSAAINLTGSTLVLTASNVASKAMFKLYDVVYIEDNDEQAYVSSVTAGGGSDVVLTHMDGSTSLTAISGTGGYLKIIGTANIENNAIPTSLTTQEIEKYNYCQIFTESIKNTGRDQAGQAYTDGKTHAEEVQKKMREMKIQYERNWMLSLTCGTRGTGGDKVSWTQGLNGRITTNVLSGYGTLEEAEWDEYLKDIFAKGSNVRNHYCGADQHLALNKIVKDKVGSLENSRHKEYGVTLTKYHHPQGTVNIIFDPVLDGKFTNWGFTVDPSKVKGRHMANDDQGSRKFRIMAGVQTPGTDRKETKLLADIGVQIEQEELHGKCYA